MKKRLFFPEPTESFTNWVISYTLIVINNYIEQFVKYYLRSNVKWVRTYVVLKQMVFGVALVFKIDLRNLRFLSISTIKFCRRNSSISLADKIARVSRRLHMSPKFRLRFNSYLIYRNVVITLMRCYENQLDNYHR